MEIKRCLKRKDGIKMVIIPKSMAVEKGDLIGLIKIDEKEVEEKYGRRTKERS